jgi:hypothetical protein
MVGYSVYINCDKLKNLAFIIDLYIKDGFSYLRNRISEGADWIWEKLSEAGSWVGDKFKEMGDYLKPILDPVKAAFGKLVLFLEPIITKVMGWATKIQQEVQEIKQSDLGVNIRAGSSMIASAFKDPLQFGKDLFGNLGGTLETGGAAVLDTAKTSISGEERVQEKGGVLARLLTEGERDKAISGFRDSQEHLQTLLSSAQAQLEGDKKVRFTEMYKQAISESGAEGTTITREEYENIMRHTLGEAVEKMVKPIKSIDDKTEKTTSQNNRTRRSGVC